MILELTTSYGLEPKKAANTQGGEYSSPCPACGGDDRFRIWPGKDGYWCRQCGKRGDSIQFLRDFQGMSFKEAASLTGKQLTATAQAKTKPEAKRNVSGNKPMPGSVVDQHKWDAKADESTSKVNKFLLKNDKRLTELRLTRGLTAETVKKHRLGFVVKQFPTSESWGIAPEIKPNGRKKKLVVPRGLVIPCMDAAGKVIRIRFRRDNDKESNKYGRYFVHKGSKSDPMILNRPVDGEHYPVIIVESELDAILLCQELKRKFTIVGLGCASMKAGEDLAAIMEQAPFVLLALDSDEAGDKSACKYWLQRFGNTVMSALPEGYGKDPTDAFLNYVVNLNIWISAGCRIAENTLGLTTQKDNPSSVVSTEPLSDNHKFGPSPTENDAHRQAEPGKHKPLPTAKPRPEKKLPSNREPCNGYGITESN